MTDNAVMNEMALIALVLCWLRLTEAASAQAKAVSSGDMHGAQHTAGGDLPVSHSRDWLLASRGMRTQASLNLSMAESTARICSAVGVCALI